MLAMLRSAAARWNRYAPKRSTPLVDILLTTIVVVAVPLLVLRAMLWVLTGA